MDHFPHFLSPPRWYVMQTKPRQEARVLDALRRHQYCGLLPLLRTHKQEAAYESAEPLFPRYLFVQLEDAAHVTILERFNGVTRVLRLNNEPALVQNSLITALQSPTSPGGGVCEAGWAMGPSPSIDAIHDMPDGAARGLELIKLVCQMQLPQFAATAMRKAA